MKRKSFLFLLGFLGFKAAPGQQILEQYIRDGWAKNQSIQQQQFALEQSIYALKEAKTLFFPKVSLMTDYFLAGGGRTVDFPAGDLLNPVYETLNQLTNGNSFPQLENQNILLNPNNFYDVRFRTSMPLINAEIEYNKRIKREQVGLQQTEVNLYKRELAKEIKTAYFNYLKAREAIKIYETTLELLQESKRINESLFKNDKVNRTTLLRAENELVKFEALLENARQNTNSAQAYFNFLLNKNFSDAILIDENYRNAATFSGDSATISQREELFKLKHARIINQHLIGLTKSYIVPRLSAFVDLGSQGFDWQYDNNTRYYFFGVSLQWDLFSSGKNYYKNKQVQLDSKIIQSQVDYVETQLQLQYTTAVNSFNASLFTYQAAISTYTTAQKVYSDMLRLYKEGQVLFIELLDAQNQWVQANLQVNISLFDTYIKAAEIERANASFNLNIN
jgi:outer membrane protein TolC